MQEKSDQTLTESSIQKQNLAELQRLLDTLHPSDIAHILEALPLNDRLLIWNLVKAEYDSEVLLVALLGVLIPLALNKCGRDPAIGSSVLSKQS